MVTVPGGHLQSMAVDAVSRMGGAGGPGVSVQEQYRYELLQRLRRRALEQRRAGSGGRGSGGAGSDSRGSDARGGGR